MTLLHAPESIKNRSPLLLFLRCSTEDEAEMVEMPPVTDEYFVEELQCGQIGLLDFESEVFTASFLIEYDGCLLIFLLFTP